MQSLEILRACALSGMISAGEKLKVRARRALIAHCPQQRIHSIPVKLTSMSITASKVMEHFILVALESSGAVKYTRPGGLRFGGQNQHPATAERNAVQRIVISACSRRPDLVA
jgi:hypothetical protein